MAYFGIPGINDHTEGLEYKNRIPIDEFLKNRDSTPRELIELRSKFFNQKDKIRKTVRIPFEGGTLVAKRNPSVFRESDEPEISFYPDNKEFNIANAQNLKDLESLQQIFSTVGGIAGALATTKSSGTNIVLEKNGVKKVVPLTQGGKTFKQQRISNKYKKQFEKIDEELTIQDLPNVTPISKPTSSSTSKPISKTQKFLNQLKTTQPNKQITTTQNKGLLKEWEGTYDPKVHITKDEWANMVNQVKVDGEEGYALFSIKETTPTQKFRDNLSKLDNKVTLPDHIKQYQLAKKFKTDKKFIEQLSDQQTKLKQFINKTADKRGYTDLRKYEGYGKDNVITAPDGEKFKYKWKDGKFQWRSLTAEGKSKLTRATGESADLTTITDIYKKHFNPKQAREAAEMYVDTQRTVKNKIDDAINRFNAGKALNDPTRLSLEHITDVKFYDRVKGDVPQFQGRGANELQNITVLDLPTNKRTGAYNKKLDHWKSVIQSVRTGRGFADYNKSVAQFIYEDIAGMVNDFKPKDWDKFLNQMLTRQGDTAYEVLLEMARKRN
jgi:hypothetical protein